MTTWKCNKCSSVITITSKGIDLHCDNFPGDSRFVCDGDLELWNEDNEPELGNNGEPIKNINPELDEDQVELERLKNETV